MYIDYSNVFLFFIIFNVREYPFSKNEIYILYMRCVKDRDLESNVVPLKLVKIERSFGCIFKG